MNVETEIQKLREHFPLLKQTMNGNPLIYFDHAATSLKPTRVLEKEMEYYTHYGVNVHRGSYTLSYEANHQYELARNQCAKFLNAKEQEIIFTSGTTASINLMAFNLAKHFLKSGDRILLTMLEHHANLLVFQQLAKDYDLIIDYVPLTDQGDLDLEILEQKLQPPTRFLSLIAISNTLGIANPISDILEKAHQKGILVHLDTAQMMAHRPLDVKQLGVDFVSFSGHKMFSPTGVGVFYGKYEYLSQFTPWIWGGGMVQQVSLDRYTLKPLPDRLEAGTPPIAQVIGLGEAIRFLIDLGWDTIQRIEEDLLHYADQIFDSLFPEIFVYGRDAHDRIPIYGFHTKQIHPHDLASFLDAQGIAVRTGQHCTHPLLQYLQVGSLTRLSLSFTNTFEELDRFKVVIQETMDFFYGK